MFEHKYKVKLMIPNYSAEIGQID